MGERKDELIDAAVDYLLANGLSDLSLRPLAAALGTSARLLVYHFGSKEGLLREVLERMHARLQGSFITLTERLDGQAPDKPLRQFWNWATSARNYPYLRLVYELQILATRNPGAYGQFLQRSSANWLQLTRSCLPASEQDAATVSLVIAVFDGLFLELMSTGDRQRTSRAIDRFIALVEDARRQRTVKSRRSPAAAS